jgi:hypothetical protein
MTISFSCTQCDHAMTAPDDAAAKIATCPECGKHQVVPENVDDPPAPKSSEIAFYEFPVTVKKASLGERLRRALRQLRGSKPNWTAIAVLAMLLLIPILWLGLLSGGKTSVGGNAALNGNQRDGNRPVDAAEEPPKNLTVEEHRELKARAMEFAETHLRTEHMIMPNEVVGRNFQATVGSTDNIFAIPVRCVGQLTARNIRGEHVKFSVDIEFLYAKPIQDLTIDIAWLEKRRRKGLGRPMFPRNWFLGVPDPFGRSRDQIAREWNGRRNQTIGPVEVRNSWSLAISQDLLIAVEPNGAEPLIRVTLRDAAGSKIATSKPFKQNGAGGVGAQKPGTFTLDVESNCGWKIELWERVLDAK